MTQRERLLSILVGGLLLATVVWWGLSKYRGAVKTRQTAITNLESDRARIDEQIMQGFLAERTMGEYLVRSLPSDTNRARGVYQQWLLDIGQSNQFDDLAVDPITTTPVGDLYRRLGFRMSGKTTKPDLVRMLHAFYAKDYLHRIRELSVRPNKTDSFTVEMTIDVVALNAAPADAQAPAGRSWHVDGDVASYLDPIMNRNYFEPPNGAPRYSGNARQEAFVGRNTPIPLTFSDPEKDRVNVEVVGELPEYVTFDQGSGTLRVNSEEKREFTVLVRGTDEGYPNRSIEQEVKIAVVDPPKPPPPPAPKLKFDDATQTVLTGLTHGRDDWTAWMHVRTRGKTLKLRVGDQFEIGSLKGEVIEVTPKFVELEIAGKRFTLKPNGNLKEAADNSQVN